jgi:hypothetical protein
VVNKEDRGSGSAGVVAATIGVALLHSVLASRKAKSVAAQVLGERNRNAFYRPFYIAQSALSFGALMLYLRKCAGIPTKVEHAIESVRPVRPMRLHESPELVLVTGIQRFEITGEDLPGGSGWYLRGRPRQGQGEQKSSEEQENPALLPRPNSFATDSS